MMLSFDEIQHRVSQWMGKKRFKHTLGVVESATQLAKLYNVDVEKARLAALLHDCAKEMVGMSTLDKVIFLADYIEPNRDFPGVDELRTVAKKDLNKAVLLGFDNTINHLIEQHLSIYPLTILGRNDVLKSCK